MISLCPPNFELTKCQFFYFMFKMKKQTLLKYKTLALPLFFLPSFLVSFNLKILPVNGQ